jgi:hypothetical protein
VLTVNGRCVCIGCLNVIRTNEECTKRGGEISLSQSEILSGWTFGLAFLFRLVPDVPCKRGEEARPVTFSPTEVASVL